MPQSLVHSTFHLIFSTKNRQGCLTDPTLRQELHAMLGGISSKIGCIPIVVGGPTDHVHLLAHLGRTVSISDWVKELKRVSSIWIKERDPAQNTFAWQQGYGAFACSVDSTAAIMDYISTQETHHATISFQQEYLDFLKRHNIVYDERYVWD